jgi:gluconate 5-dehydrogenase
LLTLKTGIANRLDTVKMPTNFDMGGQIAVVTGAGGTIGQTIAQTLARAGASVALLDIDFGRAEAAAAAIEPSGSTVRAFSVDVTSVEALKKCAATIENELGPVTALVPNAGIMNVTPADEVTEAEWDQINAVNLKGTFFTCQAFGSYMIKRGRGAMVLISSTWGVVGFPERVSYTATKTGVIGIVRALAVEWGPKGVRVNAVCPGVVQSRMNRHLFDDPKYRDYMLGRTPLRRFSDTSDVANAVHFLLSPGSAMTSGQALMVDGGWTAL